MNAKLLRSTWAVPVLIAVTSIAGLVSALTGDGWRDIVSWAALALPVAAVAWACRAHRTVPTKGERS